MQPLHAHAESPATTPHASEARCSAAPCGRAPASPHSPRRRCLHSSARPPQEPPPLVRATRDAQRPAGNTQTRKAACLTVWWRKHPHPDVAAAAATRTFHPPLDHVDVGQAQLVELLHQVPVRTMTAVPAQREQRGGRHGSCTTSLWAATGALRHPQHRQASMVQLEGAHVYVA